MAPSTPILELFIDYFPLRAQISSSADDPSRATHQPHGARITMPDDEYTTEVIGLKQVRSHKDFFELNAFEFQHRKMDGSLSPVLTRVVLERGHSVGVLPYDPERDEVLLIQQFLIGAHRADLDNCPLQVVAGMVEPGESGEDVARREAMEEAGCDIGQLRAAQRIQPSPGGSSEVIDTFVAEADLANAGGRFGLESEHEDIKAIVMSADEAIALLDAGKITAGPAVAVLQWFARRHHELRNEWLQAREATAKP
jgi:ADP-ribose pyrophosphatase